MTCNCTDTYFLQTWAKSSLGVTTPFFVSCISVTNWCMASVKGPGWSSFISWGSCLKEKQQSCFALIQWQIVLQFFLFSSSKCYCQLEYPKFQNGNQLTRQKRCVVYHETISQLIYCLVQSLDFLPLLGKNPIS